jgi:Photosynthetic reaction centre cytochrome C subunit
MRLLAFSLALAMALTLSAQEKKGGPPGPPKNLKVLPADVDIRATMGAFRAALGVQCTYCHVQGDFASDDNPKKDIARAMIRMAMDINSKFPDGKRHVSCYTCHRGEEEPKMAPPPAAPAN